MRESDWLFLGFLSFYLDNEQRVNGNTGCEHSWGIEAQRKLLIHRPGIKAQVYILPLRRDFTSTGSLKPPHTRNALLEYLANVQAPLRLTDQHSYWRNALALPAVIRSQQWYWTESISSAWVGDKKEKGGWAAWSWDRLSLFLSESSWKTTGGWEQLWRGLCLNSS